MDHGRRKQILVVEDDGDTREMLSQLFEDEGYRVACAADGQQALRLLLGDGRPDLIVTDLMMPAMSGWELLAELGSRPELKAIPTLVYSVKMHPVPDTVRYFRKPTHLGDLLAAVKELTREGAGQGEAGMTE